MGLPVTVLMELMEQVVVEMGQLPVTVLMELMEQVVVEMGQPLVMLPAEAIKIVAQLAMETVLLVEINRLAAKVEMRTLAAARLEITSTKEVTKIKWTKMETKIT